MKSIIQIFDTLMKFLFEFLIFSHIIGQSIEFLIRHRIPHLRRLSERDKTNYFDEDIVT